MHIFRCPTLRVLRGTVSDFDLWLPLCASDVSLRIPRLLVKQRLTALLFNCRDSTDWQIPAGSGKSFLCGVSGFGMDAACKLSYCFTLSLLTQHFYHWPVFAEEQSYGRKGKKKNLQQVPSFKESSLSKKRSQISYNIRFSILSWFPQVPVLGSPKAFRFYFPFFDCAG